MGDLEMKTGSFYSSSSLSFMTSPKDELFEQGEATQKNPRAHNVKETQCQIEQYLFPTFLSLPVFFHLVD